MNGAIALHGGQEFTAGDEPFIDALLRAGAEAARRRTEAGAEAARRRAELGAEAGAQVGCDSAASASADTVRVVFVPSAAARGFPDRSASNGRTAIERRAAACGWSVCVEVARIVDAASAGDPVHVARLAAADVIHLPGGDPDLVPSILAGTPALEAIRAACERGAVVAGASAGAMGLTEWTWTPGGGVRGLGLLAGVAVVPHYDDIRRTAWQSTLDRLAPGGIGYLGLDERTGVIRCPDEQGGGWLVAGAGAAWWFGRDGAEPLVGRNGDVLDLPI